VKNIFPFCPEPPDWNLDWQEINRAFNWVSIMQDCPQDSIHHAEGNVWIHTRMVCEAMISNPEWRSLDAKSQVTLFVAALMHDVAKPYCTREEDGRITSRGHSNRGEKIARAILWHMGVPFDVREQVCALIRYHQTPFFLIERTGSLGLAIEISQTARCDYLAMVAKADILGRTCTDQQRLLDNISLFSEFCRDQQCFDRPRQFPSDHSRFLYFRKEDRDPDYLAYDDTRCEVVVMSGLPGAGKDKWIRENAYDLPVISLDDLRREMKIAATDNQGPVISAARELARQYLRRQQSFVWNATNLSRQIRAKTIDLCAAYNARVRIIYVEAPEATLYEQNRQREDSVPVAVIESLIERWEMPDLTEAHRVDFVVNE
jgi:predicted kinase